jgi:IS5 family transposase
MSSAKLVSKIMEGELNEAQPEELAPLVRAAREELAEGDWRDPLLYEIEVSLWQGNVDVDLLSAYARRVGEETAENYATVLEQRYRQIAANLEEREWYTALYDEALAVVDLAETGSIPQATQIVAQIRERLQLYWTSYATTPVMEDEISGETIVTHRLLQDGVEGWLQGLDQMDLAFAGKLSYDEALHTAETANRLLVATELLSASLKDESARFQESFGL